MVEYLRMEMDQRFICPIKIDIEEQLLVKKEPFVWFTKIEARKVLPDFFVIQKTMKKYFCISNRLKELLEVYVDQWEYVLPFFPTDIEENRTEHYWIFTLKESNYLVPRSIYSVEKPKLVKRPMFREHFIYGNDGKGEYLLVSLVLAENILRKYFNGITFMPIGIKEELV